MTIALLALFGRILLLGYERILIKQVGVNADSTSITLLYFMIGTICLLPLLFFVELPTHLNFIPYALTASCTYAVGFVLYVRALISGEVSQVSSLLNLNIFFLIFIAVIFLDEPITTFKILGSCSLIYGASFLNKQENFFRSLQALFKCKACLSMIAASFFVAIGRCIDGFVVQEIHPAVYAIIVNLGICVILFSYLALNKKTKNIGRIFRAKPGLSLTLGIVSSFAYLFLLIAFTKLDVSIAEPASMLSVIVTILLAKRLFQESIRKRLIGAMIMITGAAMLFY